MLKKLFLIILLLSLFFFGRLLIGPIGLMAWVDAEKFSNELEKLKLENEKLRAEILVFEQSPHEIKIDNRDYLAAKIYSSYPFNNRSELTINVGAADGVRENDVVVLGGAIFLGRVSKVLPHDSLVQTLFDSKWKIPVRIGDSGIDAVLAGGVNPVLQMIASEKGPALGESVYTAGVGFSYGLTVGSIASVEKNPVAVFKEASIELPYNLNELSGVFVRTQ